MCFCVCLSVCTHVSVFARSWEPLLVWTVGGRHASQRQEGSDRILLSPGRTPRTRGSPGPCFCRSVHRCWLPGSTCDNSNSNSSHLSGQGSVVLKAYSHFRKKER